VKQTQSTLGGINLGESDSSTTVQRRSWSGGRSEPDLSAAWLARAARSIMRVEPERDIESFEKHDATKPSRSGAGKSFGLAPRFLQAVNGRKSLSALYYCSDFGTFNIDCRPPSGLRFVISFF
jgi:hypothetical protein